MTRPRPQRRPAPVQTNADLVRVGNAAVRSFQPDDLTHLFPPPPTERRAWTDRSREEQQGVSCNQQIRAVFTSDWFWEIAAVLPYNNLETQTFGRTRHYPSWLLFGLAEVAAGIDHFATRQRVATHFADIDEWERFAEWVDQYVPEGWTQIADLERIRLAAPTQAVAATPINSRVRARQRRRNASRNRLSRRHVVRCPSPRRHHLDYFHDLVTGNTRKVRIDHTSPWWQLPERIREAFKKTAIAQAQVMGVLDPEQPFQWRNPDPNQYLRMDGTVFRMPRNRADQLSEDHYEAGDRRRTVHGSKWTIANTRVQGQYGSRVYLDATQTGHKPQSHYSDESQAVLGMAPELRDLSNGGVKGVIVDSAVRGRAVVDLQRRHNLKVVNYPHAETNPDGGAGHRLNATRIERSHLRTIATNTGNGPDCRHLIYAVGGNLTELVRTIDTETGEVGFTLRNCEVIEYLNRANRNGCREYLTIRIDCAHSQHPWTTNVALFHTDPVTGDDTADPDYNWGEVVRVFAPTTPQFQCLYGARNDTEARHANLKKRLKYLPHNINAQQTRLYGAMIAANALAWQIHLQAHGQGNVIDNTA